MDVEESKDKAEGHFITGMSASDTFCRTMHDMICERDVELIKDTQLDALSHFEKTNEKFEKFNHLSAERFHRLHHLYQNHTKMLQDMKKDLDTVFRRIRNLKSKLAKQYGEAFTVTSKTIHKLEEEIEAEAATAYKEEKTPQDSTTQNADISNQKRGNEHNPFDGQNTNVMHEEAVGETQEKSIYSTTLRPELSSSDDSYGSDPQDSNQLDSSDTDEPMDNTVEHSTITQLCSSDESLESDSEHEMTQEISDNKNAENQNQ